MFRYKHRTKEDLSGTSEVPWTDVRLCRTDCHKSRSLPVRAQPDYVACSRPVKSSLRVEKKALLASSSTSASASVDTKHEDKAQPDKNFSNTDDISENDKVKIQCISGLSLDDDQKGVSPHGE